MFGRHFAWIQQDLLDTFDRLCPYENRTKWIKYQAIRQFNFLLNEKSDLIVFDKIVRDSYYLDKTDWLREKMRQEIAIQIKKRQ